jgi:hypothetical protein
MKVKTVTWGVIVAVAVLLGLGMPLQAVEKNVQTEMKAIGEKAEKAKPKPSPILAGPKINKFTCRSLTKGYNLMLFKGPAFDTNNRLSVNYDIYAGRGLQKIEITFDGNRVYEKTFLRPAVLSAKLSDLRINMTSVPIDRSGYYPLRLTVWDLSGKTASKEIRLRCDIERPTINGIRPANGETVYRDGGSVDVTFAFDVSDDFSGVSAVWMGGLYGSATDTTAPFSITINNIDRDTGFDIQVVDVEGNVKSDYIEIHVAPRPASLPAPAKP